MSERNDRFDVLLDKVLREERVIEPLAGLEERVMARVGEGSLASRRWKFAAWASWLGLAAAAVVLVVLLPGRHEARHGGLAVSNQRGLASTTEGAAVRGIGSGEIPSAAKAALANNGLSTRLKSRPFKANVRVEITRAARAETGSAAVARDEEARLPKLDVFPSPAPVDMFPAPVAGSEGEEELAAAAMKSENVRSALMNLQKAKDEPIRVAAIQIDPL